MYFAVFSKTLSGFVKSGFWHTVKGFERKKLALQHS